MEQYDVVVVGGGIAGLTAAATAAGAGGGAGRSVLLADTAAAGGRAATDQVGRFRFNRGAHALYRGGIGRPVLDRLGVQVRGVTPPLKDAQGRLGDRVGLLPNGPVSLARTSLLDGRSKFAVGRLLAGVRRWKPAALADRTAAQWFDELGVEGDARHVVEMVARLTSYVADFEVASADLVARQIQIALGDGVEYLHGGWASLVAALRASAEQHGARVETGVPVRRVVPVEGGGAELVLGGAGADDGGERVVAARQVVLAAGPPAANASLLPSLPAEWSAIGPPARIACLDVGLATVPDATVLLGLDRALYLIRHAPPAELAPAGGSVFHGMWYLRTDEDPSPAEAKDVLSEHFRVAGIEPDDAEEKRYLHRMVACGALPTPARGGMAGRVDVTDTGHAGVLVAGDWVGPEGHLADAALASGERAGRAAVEAIERGPRLHPIGSPAS
jgi:glycine/D-amino acid oxidase-like deaminating enzyme